MSALRFLPIILLVMPFPSLASAQQDDSKPVANAAQPQTTEPSDKSSFDQTPSDASRVVYVSDFELHVVNDEDDKKAPAAASNSKKEEKPEDPAEQACRLVDLISSTLVKELQKAGYTAHRKQASDPRPTEGLEIHGVFAEPDEQNRLRRAVIGNLSGNARMELFVGVENLARPEQPLYAVADPKSNEKKQGAVITVTAYGPVAKFELDKNATDKAIHDTAATIVADLNTLLNANMTALTQR